MSDPRHAPYWVERFGLESHPEMADWDALVAAHPEHAKTTRELTC